MSAVRAESLERRRRARPRAVEQSPRAARSSARPLPQESAGPRARRRWRPRWPSALTCCLVGLAVVGGAAVYVQGERITAQRTADGLAAEIDLARTEQRDLVVQLVRAETPEAVATGAARAGLVAPVEVAAVPAAPVPTLPAPAPTAPSPEPQVPPAAGSQLAVVAPVDVG